MEQKYKSLTIFEFQDRLKDDLSCLHYLSEIKRQDGFACKVCGHTHYFEVKTDQKFYEGGHIRQSIKYVINISLY
ncbi:hypothetical protein EZS27_035604 [termite gut metagenome]|uniref:Transposase zinc-ribbon domain-containing protein n=1 Tax=termite gut metagenome TaxID=433724 RepID=A0A5J4PVL2_9ZZZZ